MLKYKLPFHGRTSARLINNIESVDIKERLADIHEDYSLFKDLIPRMLCVDVLNRVSLDEVENILNSPVCTNILHPVT